MEIEKLFVLFGAVVSVSILLIMLINESQTVKNMRNIGRTRLDKFHHICVVLCHSNHKFVIFNKGGEHRWGELKSFIDSKFYYGANLKEVINGITFSFERSHNERFSKVNGLLINTKYSHIDNNNIGQMIDNLYDDLRAYIDYYDQRSSYVDLADKYKVKI